MSLTPSTRNPSGLRTVTLHPVGQHDGRGERDPQRLSRLDRPELRHCVRVPSSSLQPSRTIAALVVLSSIGVSGVGAVPGVNGATVTSRSYSGVPCRHRSSMT